MERSSRLIFSISTSVALFVFCATPSSPDVAQAPQIELQSNFEESTWIRSFEPKQSVPWRQGKDRANVFFDSERGYQVLEIRYPKGGVGPSAGGAQWITYFAHPSQKMTLSYWIRFPKDFDWALGAKLPGLIGGKDEKTGWPITGGILPTGENGWSARIMWKRHGEVIQYVYHMNQSGKYGDELQWKSKGKPAFFITGIWQKVTTEVTLNEPGKRNGRLRSWLNDQLVLDQIDLEFRSIPSIEIDAFCFSTFFGGEDPDWAPTKDESVRFDDFEVVRDTL